MCRGENPSEVMPRVLAAVDELNAARLPQGVHLVAIHDRSHLVDSTLHTVSHVLLAGFLIVVTVLLVFLLGIRAALLTALIIPLSLLFALVCMYASGVSLSLLSIGALDFGIIVDGTIVMVERIIHALSERERNRPNEETQNAVATAALDVHRSIVFSLLIIIAAYIPLLTLERVERRLFTPMALTVCYALLGSLLLCLTLVPVLATFVFRGRTQIKEHRLLDVITGRYEAIIRTTVRHAWLTLLVAACVVGGALYLGTRVRTEFLPTPDEGLIWIRANLPAGISLEPSAEVARAIRLALLESPEVKLAMSQAGPNDSGTDPFGRNRNELLVDLYPYKTWKSGKTKGQLEDELRQRL